MKWPIVYTFIATFMVVLGLIEKKAIYLLTAIFIYVITIIWITRKKQPTQKKTNRLFQLLELEEKTTP